MGRILGVLLALIFTLIENTIRGVPIDPRMWKISDMAFLILVTILFCIAGYAFDTLLKIRKDLNKCPAYSNKPQLRVSVDTLIDKISFLEEDQKRVLIQKIHSPIQVLIGERVPESLNAFLKTCKEKNKDIQSGLIWLIPNIDIKGYASLILDLDKEMLKRNDSFVYSTNIIPPTEFVHEEVKKHLEILNKLAGKKVKRNGKEIPRLLRVQFINLRYEKGLEKIRIIDDPKLDKYNKEKFDSNLREKDVFLEKLKTKAEEFKDYIELYIKESTFLITPQAKGASIDNILGDYILYDDSIVVKWDETNTLYLMFGEEIIKAHKKIFLDTELITKYDELKEKKAREEELINLWAYLRSNDMK